MEWIQCSWSGLVREVSLPSSCSLLFPCFFVLLEYICTWVCMQIHIYMLASVCGGQRSSLGIIPQELSSLPFERTSHLGLELDLMARLAGQWAPGICLSLGLCFPLLGLQFMPPRLALLLKTKVRSSSHLGWQALYCYFPAPLSTSLFLRQGSLYSSGWSGTCYIILG